MRSNHLVRFPFAFIFFFTNFALAQTVDEIRLSYEPAQLKATQLAAAATPDGKLLAICFDNHTVKIFDTQAQKYKAHLNVTFERLLDLQITTTGLITIVSNRELVCYEWKTGKTLKTVPLSGVVTRSQYVAATNKLVLGFPNKIDVYDLSTMEYVRTFKTGGLQLTGMSVNASGTRIALGATAGPLYLFKVYDANTGETMKSEKKLMPLLSMAYGDDDRLLTTQIKTMQTGLLKLAAMQLKGIQYTVYDAQLKEISSAAISGTGTKINNFECVLDGKKVLFSNPDYSTSIVDLDLNQIVYVSKPDKSSFLSSMNFTEAANLRILKISGTSFLFSFGNSNLMRIFNTSSNQVTGYFFADGADGFCTVARDGRMDGDMSCLNAVYWTSRKANQKTSLERTFDRGFTPRLFPKLLFDADVSIAKDFDIDEESANQVQVAIARVNGKTVTGTASTKESTKQLTLTIQVTGGKSGKTQLKVAHNGKVVHTIPVTESTSYEISLLLNNAFGSTNYVAVHAEENGISSDKAKLTVEYEGATEEKPQLFLVTIGINNYRNPKYNLNYAQADADGVESAITSLPKGLFSRVNNYAIRNDKAIKQNILKAFEQIKAVSKEQDLLVVYYAGHGVIADDDKGNSDFYLALHDLTQLYGRNDQLADKAMSATEIKSLTQTINAQKQVFLLDACQSAGALEAAAKRGVAEEKAIAQLARSTGTFWITASGSSQFATELDKLGHGVFTYVLLEGLKGNADINKDNNLTIRELSVYLEDQVPTLTEQYKGTAQFPSSYSFGNDFPITVIPK